MTTASQAYAAARAQIEAAGLSYPLRWQNEDADSTGAVAMPDAPSPFAYIEFIPMPGELVSYGGGRGNNRYRNRARIEAYVFVPRGWGSAAAMDRAEALAASLRSFRSNDISCFDASVEPGGDGSAISPVGLPSEVNNYYFAFVTVSMFFDQIG